MEEIKKCPYCGEEILAGAKKCKYCDEWLEKKQIPCPICHREIDADSTECPYCHGKIITQENETLINHGLSEKSVPIVASEDTRTNIPAIIGFAFSIISLAVLVIALMSYPPTWILYFFLGLWLIGLICSIFGFEKKLLGLAISGFIISGVSLTIMYLSMSLIESIFECNRVMDILVR